MMTEKVRLLFFPLAVILLFQVFSSNAAAQDDIDTEEAKKHFTKGVKLYEKKDYRLALDEFIASFNLKPHYNVRYNIGICYLKLGQNGKALTHLLKFLELGGDNIPKKKMAEVESFIAKLQKKVGVIRISGITEKIKFFIDGQHHPEASTDMYVFVDPGPRHVKAIKGTEVIYKKQVTVAKGEEVLIDLAPQEEAVKTERGLPKPHAVSLEDEESVKPGSVKKPFDRKKTMRGLWIGLGVFSAMLAASAVTMALAIDEGMKMRDVEDELDETWNQLTVAERILLLAEQDDHHDKSRKLALSTYVLFGVGMAGAASVSLALIIFAIKGKREKKPGSPGQAGLLVGPDAFYFQYRF